MSFFVEKLIEISNVSSLLNILLNDIQNIENIGFSATSAVDF